MQLTAQPSFESSWPGAPAAGAPWLAPVTSTPCDSRWFRTSAGQSSGSIDHSPIGMGAPGSSGTVAPVASSPGSPGGTVATATSLTGWLVDAPVGDATTGGGAIVDP